MMTKGNDKERDALAGKRKHRRYKRICRTFWFKDG